MLKLVICRCFFIVGWVGCGLVVLKVGVCNGWIW